MYYSVSDCSTVEPERLEGLESHGWHVRFRSNDPYIVSYTKHSGGNTTCRIFRIFIAFGDGLVDDI
jgi:hypothetical protein